MGNHCAVPSEINKILVVDLSGHHTVCVRFCRCSKGGLLENYRQLLRVNWYPASVLRPKTVFTFDLLDTYHKISLQGKLNLYDFYNVIMQKTDNCGSLKPKVGCLLSVACSTTHPHQKYRYHEMSRCVRQWRHLKDIKRGGAGHALSPVDELDDGSLAIECPACPHPGRNLPIGWDTEVGTRAYVITATSLINPNISCMQVDLLPIFGDRCELPAEAQDARDKGSGARVGSSILRGHCQVSRTPQKSHS